jgi:hypothetical protein
MAPRMVGWEARRTSCGVLKEAAFVLWVEAQDLRGCGQMLWI